MDHNILHFFTGTMAFRSPQPPVYGSGTEPSDAFLEKNVVGKNRNAGKAAKSAEYARNMQDGVRSSNKQGNHRLNRAAKNTQGRNGLGNGQEGQVIRQGAT